MRIASRLGRSVIVEGNRCADIENASQAAFSHKIDDLYQDWPAFLQWARKAAPVADQPFEAREPATPAPVADQPLEVAELHAPAQRPRQVFAIGLNYLDHAAESGVKAPASPTV